MLRRRALPLLSLLALSLLVGSLAAREEKKPSELYAEKERKFVKAIAARYVGVAKWDFKNKLFQFAIMDYETVLKVDPDNKDARKYLGYVRRRGQWVLDPAEKPLQDKNQKPQGWTDTDMKKLYRERDELLDQVKAYAANKYAELGLWCRKKPELQLQAKKAFEIALKNDPECEKARKALGHVRIDGEWLTPKQAKARQEAKEGRIVDGGSIWEGALNLRLNKMESAHFRIETVFPLEELKRYIKDCETAYAYFLRDFGEDPTRDLWPGRKGTLLVLATKAQWHAFVDRFGGRNKEFTKSLKGTRGMLRGAQYQGEEGGIDTTVDGLVHKATHFLVSHHLHLEQTWIQEGFAYYYTVKVMNTTRTHCVAWDRYSNVRNDQDWGQSENWKELIKEAVRNKEDWDLRQIIGLKLSQMKQPHAVKAWSVITWFFDHRRETFMEWLAAVAAGEDQEEAFKRLFGKGLEELDREWRAYVLENY